MADAKRFPREYFQQALERILEQVAKAETYRVQWRFELLRETVVSEFQVSAVYVVGSWARGAPECGDLDLVVTLQGSRDVPSSALRRVIGRGARYVQFHIGTPEENSSHAPFPEARLLWSPERADWRENLAAIRPNPNAGRYARKSDALPLRLAQLRLYDLDEADSMVDLIESGVVASEWVELNTVAPVPESWDRETQWLYERISDRTGAQSRRILPVVVQHLWDLRLHGSRWRHRLRDRSEFSYGPCIVRLGRPRLEAKSLERIDVSALVMAPHISTRGPNGLWVLRRGPSHPLRKLFDGVQAWAIADARGSVCHDRCTAAWTEGRYREFFAADLFTSQTAAQRRVATLTQDGEADLRTVLLSGVEILDAVGHADALYAGNEEILLSSCAKLDEESTVMNTPEALASALRRALRPREKRAVAPRVTRPPSSRSLGRRAAPARAPSGRRAR